MLITPLHTAPLVPGLAPDLMTFLDHYVTPLHEKDILVITSKIVAICEGSYRKKEHGVTKDTLVPEYAQWYIPASHNTYGICITITDDIMVASSGLDESNGAGHIILWPRDAFETARTAWSHLRTRFGLRQLGVIISDSRTTPMRWGVTAQAIAWCGIEPLHSYIGMPDIFGVPLHVTRVSVVDSLATAAALTMGEGGECQPLALIQDVALAHYTDHAITQEEEKSLRITMDDDLYGMFLKGAPWVKGKGK